MLGLQHRNQHRRIKDFVRRERRNPIFAYRQKQQGLDRRLILVVVSGVAGIALLAVAVWFLAWGPALRVTDISIIGASPATEEKIRRIIDDGLSEKALGFIPRTNVPFFDATKAGESIRAAYYFEDLTLKTRLPHSLTVTVKEKSVAAVFINENRFLGLDAAGFVVRELTDREIRDMTELPPDIVSVASTSLGATVVDLAPAAPTGKKGNANPLPLIERNLSATKNARPVSAVPGKQALSTATIGLIVTAYARLPDIAGPVLWFQVDEDSESVQAAMDGGWTAHLTSALPFDVQGNRLGLVLKETVKEQRSKLQYIDLRYNEKVFIRYVDQPEPVGDKTAP